MGIRRCHHRRVSLSHHHVSIFVGAAARSAAFATAAIVAAMTPKHHSCPHLNCQRSGITIPPPLLSSLSLLPSSLSNPPHTSDTIVDVDNLARLICAAPGGSQPDPRRHQCQGTRGPLTDNNQLKATAEEGAGLQWWWLWQW